MCRANAQVGSERRSVPRRRTRPRGRTREACCKPALKWVPGPSPGRADDRPSWEARRLVGERMGPRRPVRSAWRDFGIWPRSARRTVGVLLVLIGVFLPAACADTTPTEDEDVDTTSTTVAETTTTEAAPTTTSPPTTSEPPPTTAPSRAPTTAAPSASARSFANCSEARAAGAAPLSRGEPGYSSNLDRDNDGIACET